MSNNRLAGTIPVELNDLAFLQRINLLGNQFTGKLPASLKARLDVHIAWDSPPEL